MKIPWYNTDEAKQCIMMATFILLDSGRVNVLVEFQNKAWKCQTEKEFKKLLKQYQITCRTK